MTITFPYPHPTTPVPRVYLPQMFDPVAGTMDPYTGTTQLQVWPWGRLTVEVQLPPMQQAAAQDWIGWRAGLGGREGTFLLTFLSDALLGAGGGTPVVNGAAQNGKTLITDGHPINTLVYKRGDPFQIGSAASSELKRVTQDGTSDGSGNLTIDLWPRIRAAPGDGTAIITTSPQGLFRMVDNSWGWQAQADPRVFQLTFRAEEAF